MMKIMATMKLHQMSLNVLLLKQKLHPVWLIQTVLWECCTNLLSFTSTQQSLLRIRLNGSLALESKTEQAVRHQL